MKTKYRAILYAIVAAAALYAVNAPFSKVLLERVHPTMMAAFLYLGAGIGLFVYGTAKTSAYYSIAPFLGVTFGMVLLGERPGVQFYVALAVMVVSTWLMMRDTLKTEETT